MDKDSEKLLKKLRTWANPIVQILYAETSINKDSSLTCVAVGSLKHCDTFFIKEIIKEIIIVPIQKHPIMASSETGLITETPIEIHIPLTAIIHIYLMIPEDSSKVKAVKLHE